VQVAFRVDAAAHIGIGHFMRCLALADAMSERGATPLFVSRHLSASVRGLLEARGYLHVKLCSPSLSAEPDPVPHAAWLGTTQQADACETLGAIGTLDLDWLVVDHYALDARWESMLRGAARGIMVIDDVADRRHECDILLDQNLFVDAHTRYMPFVGPTTVQLLGPRFALLRPEFARLRGASQVRDGTVRRILVSLGGADVRNETMKVVRAIASIPNTDLKVDVVIGESHSARLPIEDACRSYDFGCHVAPPDLARLMAAADLAVGAAGSTSWERCCIGTPTLLITQAWNQVPIARGLEAYGAAVCLGDGATLDEQAISEGIALLMRSPDRIRNMSAAARQLVDGRGADRVCNYLVDS
jgi:UDP-2,4-diacetamido-2,4,6-trideoxy-beta-L-altropyranose hydrolase